MPVTCLINSFPVMVVFMMNVLMLAILLLILLLF